MRLGKENLTILMGTIGDHRAIRSVSGTVGAHSASLRCPGSFG